MWRFLFFFVIAMFVVWQLRRMLANKENNGAKKAPPTSKPEEKMVTCQHCGLNLPESESYSARGTYYCSDEHLRLGTKN
jgi:uncharacterized protein